MYNRYGKYIDVPIYVVYGIYVYSIKNNQPFVCVLFLQVTK